MNHPHYETYLKDQLEFARGRINELEHMLGEKYFGNYNRARGIAYRAAQRIFDENKRLRTLVNELEAEKANQVCEAAKKAALPRSS